MFDSNFIMKKVVDKSVLYYGFNIPKDSDEILYALLGERMEHGESRRITLIFEGESYEATLTNVNFKKNKFPGHRDLLQVRYTVKSPIARMLSQMFSTTSKYIARMQTLSKDRIIVPEEIREYFNFFATSVKGVFYIQPIYAVTKDLNLEVMMSEEDFELSPLNWIAKNIRKEEQEQIMKIRAIDNAICDGLKQMYDYHCQVTGEYLGNDYGGSIIEAHHIEYFVRSQNNNASNIIILSPNFHRAVHKFRPMFDRSKLQFQFPNGVVEKVRINKHL